MDEKGIFKLCKDEGCCDACSLRYLGLHHPKVYEDVKESAKKYQDETSNEQDTYTEAKTTTEDNNGPTEQSSGTPSDHSNGTPIEQSSGTPADLSNGTPIEQSDGTNGVSEDTEGSEEPAAKRRRGGVCVSCLGLLQQDTWADSCRMAKELLDKKGYDCTTFACALSAPIAVLLREKRMQLVIKDKFPGYNIDPTSLKEAWKWSFGPRLASHVGLALDSGSVCPLLLTLHYEYPAEGQELEVLKSISPSTFLPHLRPAVDVTRRGAELALARATLPLLQLPAPGATARAVAATAARAPLYIAGRYLKLSRQLPQTPWILRGQRMMESSVQEIIFQPVADIYKLSPAEVEHRMKLVSAGREDVDVRCLGEGRPFALEISDPCRELTAAELAGACERISRSGTVVVKRLVHVTKDDLMELKKGEESKCKEYEALCIKLEHSDLDQPVSPNAPVVVTDADIARINTYRNTEPGSDVRVRVLQKTPLRVLHRRPLLTRPRDILDLQAFKVPDHPSLFRLRIVTMAGTYIKEWCHGELRRSAPALPHALGARADIAALDVTRVLLPWPPNQ